MVVEFMNILWEENTENEFLLKMYCYVEFYNKSSWSQLIL